MTRKFTRAIFVASLALYLLWIGALGALAIVSADRPIATRIRHSPAQHRLPRILKCRQIENPERTGMIGSDAPGSGERLGVDADRLAGTPFGIALGDAPGFPLSAPSWAFACG